tara:strand:- start:1112 stop:1525 length:414 start_codon:yes stop_codon:yes gene_type:complete
MNNKNEIYLKVLLSQHLDCDIEEIEQGYCDSTFELGNQEYLVLTDQEADERVKEYIEESIWAFSPWFLASHTGLDEEIIKHLQDKCEGANDVLLNAIKNVDDFINDAISCDGRGHFMSSYDGQEQELDNNLFLYRTN